MVKFLTKGRVVVVLQGRFAGCKAVIMSDHGPTRKHKFPYCIVAGISQPPKRVTKAMSREQVEKKSSMKTFLKVMNQVHLMPTRYKLRVNLGTCSVKQLSPKEGKKKELRKNIRSKFKDMYFNNHKPSQRWFFKKLYF